MTTLKLTAIGPSTGVIIPQDMLDRMRVVEGDVLYATEYPDGSFRLTSHDPASARTMDKAEEIMLRYKNTLHALAQ